MCSAPPLACESVRPLAIQGTSQWLVRGRTTQLPIRGANTMATTSRSCLVIGVVLGGGLAAAPIYAQTEGAAKPAAGEQKGLEEIVVVATKRETNLQDTPIAITVVDNAALEDRHVQSLLDLADGSVPSLRI